MSQARLRALRNLALLAAITLPFLAGCHYGHGHHIRPGLYYGGHYGYGYRHHHYKPYGHGRRYKRRYY